MGSKTLTNAWRLLRVSTWPPLGWSNVLDRGTHARRMQGDCSAGQAQKTACLVSPEEHQVVCLERLNLTESQRRDAINYRAGQVVEFHRRARGGFKSGEKWEVIASDEKGVTVSRAGKQTLLPLAQANSFELCERRDTALAAGDSSSDYEELSVWRRALHQQ